MIEAIATSKIKNTDEKGCRTCCFCQAAVSWWCVNKDAIELNQTKIPDKIGCKFWKRMRSIDNLTWIERTFKDFIYI